MTVSQKPTILILDDEASVLAALERLFRQNYNVICCQTVQEAQVKLTQTKEIAVVLSDYQLPDSTGLEFLKIVQEYNPNIFRIILTGALKLDELQPALQSGVVLRIFRKPWENDFLKLQMTEAILQHQALAERETYEKLAITDPITGLYNQRHLQSLLPVEIERAKRHQRVLTLIMIDIDFFKNLNDQKGHPEGNHQLIHLAQILKDSVRNIDIVFRYAGDEFSIILPETDITQAKEIAERIRKKCQPPNFATTLSLGIASFPSNAQSADELIGKADQALYLAKKQGKNQTVIAE